MTINQFKNLLAFCILMGGGRVITKSPDYILEKYGRYVGHGDEIGKDGFYRWGLDHVNQGTFLGYLDLWKTHIEGYFDED